MLASSISESSFEREGDIDEIWERQERAFERNCGTSRDDGGCEGVVYKTASKYSPCPALVSKEVVGGDGVTGLAGHCRRYRIGTTYAKQSERDYKE